MVAVALTARCCSQGGLDARGYKQRHGGGDAERRAGLEHVREQVWPGRGHEVPRVHAGVVRRHVPGGRHQGARVRCQSRAGGQKQVTSVPIIGSWPRQLGSKAQLVVTQGLPQDAVPGPQPSEEEGPASQGKQAASLPEEEQ